MPSFTYNPGPDDPEVIRTLGHTFTAGESVDFPDDHPNVQKLRGNRFFSEEGQGEEQAPAFDERQAKANLAAEKKIDGRTKEAREARQKAAEAAAEAERLERQADSSRRSLGALSDAERRAMEQQRGLSGDDGEPVPGELGWRDPADQSAGQNMGIVPRDRGGSGPLDLTQDSAAKEAARSGQRVG